MTNFLEQQVEALIVAAANAAISGVTVPADAAIVVQGFWQPSLAGTVKETRRADVRVKIVPRANAAYGSRIVTLSGDLTIKVPPELSPTGDLLSGLAGPLLNLLNGWNVDPAAFESAVSVSGVFCADGFIFTAGGDADFDLALGVWYARVSFEIKGHLLTA